MRRFSILFLLLLLTVLMASPAESQRPRRTPPVQATQSSAQPSISMVVIDRQSATTSSPNNVLYTVSVRFTNSGSTLVQFTNNNLALVDKSGKKYFVSRLRFAETVSVSPGGSTECTRVFFEVPRDAQISEVVLFLKGKTVAATKF